MLLATPTTTSPFRLAPTEEVNERIVRFRRSVSEVEPHPAVLGAYVSGCLPRSMFTPPIQLQSVSKIIVKPQFFGLAGEWK